MTFVQGLDEAAATGLGAAGLALAPAPVPAEDDRLDDMLFDLGGDERRMHARAYNHWVSLLKGRPCPVIADLDPASILDFGANSVLLDFSAGPDDPKIAFLGRALRDECELAPHVAQIAEVPRRSLLSRLTDHYRQIIANRAPIGFEAEFIGTRGRTTFYRGILMPFSSDGSAIDFIYGVVNWKEVADVVTQASLDAELAVAVRAAPAPGIATDAAPIWADGPSADGPDTAADLREALRDLPVLATLTLDTASPAGGDYTLLVARAAPDGTMKVVATLDHRATLDAALRRVTGRIAGRAA